jgi:hypothetical protein
MPTIFLDPIIRPSNRVFAVPHFGTDAFQADAAGTSYISCPSISKDGTTDFSVLRNELKGRSSKIAMIALRQLLN